MIFNSPVIQHVYNNLSDIGLASSPAPTLHQVAVAMPDRSIFFTDAGVFDMTGMTDATNVTIVVLVKVNIYRVFAIGVRSYGSTSLAQSMYWFATYNNNSSTFNGWIRLDDRVNRSGDTMTGHLIMQGANVNIRSAGLTLGTTPASNAWGNSIPFTDQNGSGFGGVSSVYFTDGSVGLQIGARYGTGQQNILRLRVTESGTKTVDLDSGSWRTALGVSPTTDIIYPTGTYTLSNTGVYGWATNSGKDIQLIFTAQKLLPNGTLKITKLWNSNLRGVGVSGNANIIPNTTDLTSKIVTNTFSVNGGFVFGAIIRNSSSWGATTNTPVVGSINITFTIS